MDKPIVYSRHASEQVSSRGATLEEVEIAIRTGEQVPAKQGRQSYRKNFPFQGEWKGGITRPNRLYRWWLSWKKG